MRLDDLMEGATRFVHGLVKKVVIADTVAPVADAAFANGVHPTTTGAWLGTLAYIPLGGNRGSSGRVYFNLVLVFVLVGLWHGAQWTFIAWGAYHGTLLIVERRLNSYEPQVGR